MGQSVDLREARRYRYYDIWRTRVRVMEVGLFVPLLLGEGVSVESGWNAALAKDYSLLQYHITFWEAFGRRLRRNYIWIFVALGASYFAKLLVHPQPLPTTAGILRRASIGPVDGAVVISVIALVYCALFVIAFITRQREGAGGVGGVDEDLEANLRAKGIVL